LIILILIAEKIKVHHKNQTNQSSGQCFANSNLKSWSNQGPSGKSKLKLRKV